MSNRKFDLGQVVITPGAVDVIPYEDILLALARHKGGDWGALEIAHVTGVDLPRDPGHGFEHIDDIPLPTATALLKWFYEVARFRPMLFENFEVRCDGNVLLFIPTARIEYLRRWEPPSNQISNS